MYQDYALLCGGLVQPHILAIGAEVVLASAERYVDHRGDQARSPDMHIRLVLLEKMVMSGSVPGLSLPSGGPNAVGNWRIGAP